MVRRILEVLKRANNEGAAVMNEAGILRSKERLSLDSSTPLKIIAVSRSFVICDCDLVDHVGC